MQPRLGPPPKHIVSGHRPFVLDKVLHLASKQLPSKVLPEVGFSARVSDDVACKPTVSARQRREQGVWEHRVALDQPLDMRLETSAEASARQSVACRPGRAEVSKPRRKLFQNLL